MKNKGHERSQRERKKGPLFSQDRDSRSPEQRRPLLTAILFQVGAVLLLTVLHQGSQTIMHIGPHCCPRLTNAVLTVANIFVSVVLMVYLMQSPVLSQNHGFRLPSTWLSTLWMVPVVAFRLIWALRYPVAPHMDWVLVVSVVAVHVTVSFFEELLDREIVLRFLRVRGDLLAAILSALIFGFSHITHYDGNNYLFTAGHIIASLASGLLYAALRLHTGSLLPSFLLHASTNMLLELSNMELFVRSFGGYGAYLGVFLNAVYPLLVGGGILLRHLQKTGQPPFNQKREKVAGE